MRGNVGIAEKKIKQLVNKDTFYDDVREIVGFNDDKIWWEDWDIKHLQRVADCRYSEIGGK